MSKFTCTKTFGTDRGFTCTYRHWRAQGTRATLIHGFSLGFKVTFEADSLDAQHWCMDFSNLAGFKAWLDHMFDHTLIVAKDDPQLAQFQALADFNTFVPKPPTVDPNTFQTYQEDPQYMEPYRKGGLCDMRLVDGVGCEMFAKMAFDKMTDILHSMRKGVYSTRFPVNTDVRVLRVEVMEHGSNSATYGD